ncbi:copper resistance CopC family protein [Actinosynnema sp. NPDC051121]|nr:copper resistance protein CopC [Saccharothrix sp.]
MTRLALSALLATLALLGAAAPASAHTDLVSSDPASGASLPQRPTRLTLVFSDPVPAESATVAVLAPDGSAWSLGEIVADGATLSVPVLSGASPAGPHTVSWKVESLDGDFADGTFGFTVTAPASAQQPPAATTPAAPPAVTSGDVPPTSSAAPTGSVATLTDVPTRTSTPSASTGADDDGGVPLWVWILVAAVLAVIGIAVGVGLNRRAKGDTADEPAE